MTSSPHVIAAIDVGTNSIHMVIARTTLDGFEVITREKVAARLGEGGGDMKKLSEPAMDRGIQALRHMRRIADVHKATVFAVATSAVREASNANLFVRRALSEADIEVEVISGVEEARLIHLGVLQALPLQEKRSLLIDIGGGSTEVVVFEHVNELFARSLKLGAVRLTNRFFADDSRSSASDNACRRFIRSTVEPIRREVLKLKYDIAVVSSGTAETIARMAHLLHSKEIPRNVNGLTFTSEDLHEVARITELASTVEERRQLAGMDDGRADIILAGILILEELADTLGIEVFTYCDYALREGVLLDASRRLAPEIDKDLRNVAITSARKLASRCDDDLSHALNLARLSCNLFDELSGSFEIEPYHRLYLELAAVLANVGLVVSHGRHHLHSYYIIRHSDLVGLTDHEIELVAQIARYHRKSEPKNSHPAFASLNDDDQHLVTLLSGILRIAVGLDRTQDGRVSKLTISTKRERLTIQAASETGSDLELNIFAANERSSVLAEVLGHQVVIEPVN